MNLLLAYVHINHSYDEYDCKQNQRRGACAPLVGIDIVVYKPDHSIKAACATRRSHTVAEDTYYARIFLKPADKARNYDVGYHRG